MALKILTDLMFFFSVCMLHSSGLRGREISDIRRFHVDGVAGIFLVPRKVLSEKLNRLKEQDTTCGNDVELSVPELGLEHSESSGQAEIFVSLVTIEDITLKEELTDDMKDNVAIKYTFLTVGTPFLSGQRNGLLFDNAITDSHKHVLNPYFTNYQAIKRVDRVNVRDNGTVVIYKNDDVIVLNIQNGKECKANGSGRILKDFDDITGKGIATNYPLPFDWGCDLLQSENVSFCQIIQENLCDLHRAGINVCTTESTSISKRCPATLIFLNITGIFKDELLSFIPSAPVTSSEAEWIHREHSAGILFPCFTH